VLGILETFFDSLLNDLIFLFQRLNWTSVLDIALVTAVIFVVLIIVRDTQAVVLLRGVVFLIILLSLLTTLVNLPAFSWLLQTTLPALLLAIPVIFAPEIRRALERLGRAGSGDFFWRSQTNHLQAMETALQAIVSASARLSARRHGALIVLQRQDSLTEYTQTGVLLDAVATPEILLQIFYPNTPLHDGAVIIIEGKIVSAACVLPLSASGILTRSPERQMGLRHRAALGISEASDAIAVVVSEETGSISIAHGGRMIRRLDSERLENILYAFYRSPEGPPSAVRAIREFIGLPEPAKKKREE
jgi:diadenylate cyclase